MKLKLKNVISMNRITLIKKLILYYILLKYLYLL